MPGQSLQPLCRNPGLAPVRSQQLSVHSLCCVRVVNQTERPHDSLPEVLGVTEHLQGRFRILDDVPPANDIRCCFRRKLPSDAVRNQLVQAKGSSGHKRGRRKSRVCAISQSRYDTPAAPGPATHVRKPSLVWLPAGRRSGRLRNSSSSESPQYILTTHLQPSGQKKISTKIACPLSYTRMQRELVLRRSLVFGCHCWLVQQCWWDPTASSRKPSCSRLLVVCPD